MSRSQMRAALSAHGGGDEAETCVCRPQPCAALSHMMAETKRAHARATRRSAHRSPHMVAETKRTRVCVCRPQKRA